MGAKSAIFNVKKMCNVIKYIQKMNKGSFRNFLLINILFIDKLKKIYQ